MPLALSFSAPAAPFPFHSLALARLRSHQRVGLTPERLATLNFLHVAGTKGKVWMAEAGVGQGKRS